MTTQPSRQRGVSLIEALVAMAVMGVGMLGVLGLQASLRGNADVSKQRSEAVRIAQETIETARAFSVLGAAPGASAYDAITSAGPTTVTPVGANSTYSVQTIVTTLPGVGQENTVPPYKQIVVNVSWLDRSNETQTVRLATTISATAPEVTAALGTPGDAAPVQRPAGRHFAIPQLAVNLGNGTSSFTPPGAASGVSWTFNNSSGFITQLCISAACTDFPGRLVSGFVNFATDTSAPTPANAENPLSPVLTNASFDAVAVRVITTEPAAGTVTCFRQAPSGGLYLSYFCAVPITAVQPFYWSGRVELVLPVGLDLATSITDNSASRYRVCRYTTTAARVVPHLIAPSAIRNEDHPLDYYRVPTSLVAQNFLVVRAGTGAGAAFDCPADDTATPEVSGATWHHQPSS